MKRIHVNEDVCMGCGICRIACQVSHSNSKDMIKTFKQEASPLPRIRVERKAEISLSIQCQHCDEPWCVYSCLTGAMQKDPVTGIVSVDTEKCMGCWTCILACPNGALTRDMVNRAVVKCDLCPGLSIPACVSSCPNSALAIVEDEIAVASA